MHRQQEDTLTTLIKEFNQDGTETAHLLLLFHDPARMEDFRELKKMLTRIAHTAFGTGSKTMVGIVQFGAKAYVRQEFTDSISDVDASIDKLKCEMMGNGIDVAFNTANKMLLSAKSNQLVIFISNKSYYDTKHLEKLPKFANAKVVFVGTNSDQAAYTKHFADDKDVFIFPSFSNVVERVEQAVEEKTINKEPTEKEVEKTNESPRALDGVDVLVERTEKSLSIDDENLYSDETKSEYFDESDAHVICLEKTSTTVKLKFDIPDVSFNDKDFELFELSRIDDLGEKRELIGEYLVPTALIRNLKPNTEYFFAVRAKLQDGSYKPERGVLALIQTDEEIISENDTKKKYEQEIAKLQSLLKLQKSAKKEVPIVDTSGSESDIAHQSFSSKMDFFKKIEENE
jgi:hypothetical protein